MPKAGALVGGNDFTPTQTFDVVKYINIVKADEDRKNREKLTKVFRDCGFSVGVIQHKKPA
tara:strand:- start:137 stop:319 length:183 start_codon:yes stop_codon:yes gene_type:complete